MCSRAEEGGIRSRSPGRRSDRCSPPGTTTHALQPSPLSPSVQISLSLSLSLSISSRDRYLRSSPPSKPAHYVSIYVWMHLKQRRRGKTRKLVQHVDAPHSRLGISCFPRGFWILRYASTVEMNTSFDIWAGTWESD